MLKRLFFLCALSFMLSACGFKLRGYHDDVSLRDVRLNLSIKAVDPIFVERLEQSFKPSLEAKKGKTLFLELLELRYEKRNLTIDSAGRVSEYELIQTLSYKLFRKNPDSASEYIIRTQRLMAFDRAQLLVKEREERFLIKEMNEDLIRQLKNHVRHFD